MKDDSIYIYPTKVQNIHICASRLIEREMTIEFEDFMHIFFILYTKGINLVTLRILDPILLPLMLRTIFDGLFFQFLR